MKVYLSFLAVILTLGMVTLIVPSILWAEPAYISFKSVVGQIDSRDRVSLLEEDGGPIFRETIQVAGAIWLRLQFGEYNLGSKSYVLITSMEDGGQQRLDSRSMPDYRNRSAFFNGDRVTVELFAVAEDDNIFITVDAVYYGESGGAAADTAVPDKVTLTPEEISPTPEDLCGTDDRVSTTDPAVGRFVFFDAFNNMIAKCTVWIASNGAHVSAGHCFQRSDYGDPDLLEFNVPLSDLNGDPNFADPDDQYPVDLTSYVRHENGVGDDWSVFDCNPNSNTGLLPVQGQNDFFRVAKASDSSPGTIRITGYGVDTGDRNRTLQTDTGPYLGENGSGSVVDVEYQVDTLSGNSGGPVILNGTETSIGVHTHAGCDPVNNQGNHGTSFENNDLEAAIQGFLGTNVIYSDGAHPVSSALENGTVLRPYDTIPEAAAAVPNGGRISIVAGSYTKAAGNTFTLGADGKSMLVEAPVGTVTIGQ